MCGLVTLCALNFDPVAFLKSYRTPNLIMRDLGCELSINNAEHALFRRGRIRYDSSEVEEAFGQDGEDFTPQVRLCEELRVFEYTQLSASIVTIKRVFSLLAIELVLPVVTI